MPAAKKPLKSDSTSTEKAYAKGTKKVKSLEKSARAKYDSAVADEKRMKPMVDRHQALVSRMFKTTDSLNSQKKTQDSLSKVVKADSVKRGLKKSGGK
jgi:hypothetical protein